jgi:hypothetical protein
MKRAAASGTVRQASRQAIVRPQRIWRVFEYRRPVAAARPRFTT